VVVIVSWRWIGKGRGPIVGDRTAVVVMRRDCICATWQSQWVRLWGLTVGGGVAARRRDETVDLQGEVGVSGYVGVHGNSGGGEKHREMPVLSPMSFEMPTGRGAGAEA